MDNFSPIRIATRPSRLAIYQAELAAALVRTLCPNRQVNLVPITSEADAKPDTPLATFGDKGAFVARIDQAILEKEADVSVHSMKDVPLDLTDGLELAAFLAREDPRDVLASRQKVSFRELPSGSRVGTSSPRRAGQLAQLRPDLRFEEIRGNVDTRLRKMHESQYDAIVLAAAGLIRLGLADQITEYFSPEECTPAPAQGIIGLTCLAESPIATLLRTGSDGRSQTMARTERLVAKMAGADCQSSFGVLATIEGTSITIIASNSREGNGVLREQKTGPVSEAMQLAEAIGLRMSSGTANL